MYMDENIKKRKIGLALSGGGYRAAAYHIGTLRALNRLRILEDIDVISSVSGGSITAAYYALNKDDFNLFEKSFISKLKKGVLCTSIINLLIVVLIVAIIGYSMNGWFALLSSLIVLFLQYKVLPFSFFIEKSYDRLFFQKKKLQELPSHPLIAINSTDVTTGTLFTFSKEKMSGYKYRDVNNGNPFNNKEFPISKAVMASSCVPFAFSPIKISSKYYVSEIKDDIYPLLIDGGLYDNQGAHKLGEKNSIYHTQINIVSDAGNSEINSKYAVNTLMMLIKTSGIMMNRIRTFQSRNNMFMGIKDDIRYVYLGLLWDVNDRPVRSFVRNIVEGNIAQELYDCHKIKDSDIEALKSADKTIRETKENELVDKLKNNISWSELEKIMPSAEEHNIAKKVGTNLTGLNDKKINALIKHSNWLTEVQIRLYMPYLLTK